jgi:hypothetical protein
MRPPWATLVAFAVGGCGSGSAQPPSHAAPDWLNRAVSLSAWYLRDVCDEVAPAALVDPANPEYRRCVRESVAAMLAERQRLYDAALARCGHDETESPVWCCFERLSDAKGLDRTFQEKCNAECASKTNRTIATGSPESCRPLSVTPPPLGPEKQLTEAVRTITRECVHSPSAIEKCQALKSAGERTACRTICEPTVVPVPALGDE